MVLENIKNLVQRLGQTAVLYGALMGAPSFANAQEAPTRQATLGFTSGRDYTSTSGSISQFSNDGGSWILNASNAIRVNRLLEASGNSTSAKTVTGNGTGFWRKNINDSEVKATLMVGAGVGDTYEGEGSDSDSFKGGVTLSNNAFTGGFVYRVNNSNNDNRDSTSTTTDWKLGAGLPDVFGLEHNRVIYGNIQTDTDNTIKVNGAKREFSHNNGAQYLAFNTVSNGASISYTLRETDRTSGKQMSHRGRIGFDLGEGKRLYVGGSQTGGFSDSWDVRFRAYDNLNLVRIIESTEESSSIEGAGEILDQSILKELTKRRSYLDAFFSQGNDKRSRVETQRLGLQYGVHDTDRNGSNGWNLGAEYTRSTQEGIGSQNQWGLSAERTSGDRSYFGNVDFENNLDRVSIGLGLRWNF